MKNRNQNKITAIDYNCIYCSKSEYYSVVQFSAHLEMVHENISELDKKELLKDLQQKIIIQRKNLKKQKLKKSIIEETLVKTMFFIEYKNKVLEALKYAPIDQIQIEKIKSRKNIRKLKTYINFNLKNEIKAYLDKAEIDYNLPSKSKNKNTKLKSREFKNFNDETKHSIKIIYTPMGNKR